MIDIRVGPRWSDVGLRMKKVSYSLLLSASRSLVFAALSEICVEVGHGLIMLQRLYSHSSVQCSDQLAFSCCGHSLVECVSITTNLNKWCSNKNENNIKLEFGDLLN